MKTVLVEVRTMVLLEYADDAVKEDVEFHLNESSSCIQNVLGRLGDDAEQCGCPLTECRVLVRRRNSNLKLYGQWIYTALVHRVPDSVHFNNLREYSYRAENGCHLWGQDVVSWMRVPECY